MSCRKQCKECPYKVKTNHNEKFKSRIEKLHRKGIIKTKTHKCHMIDTGWEDPNKDNVCIGSLNN